MTDPRGDNNSHGVDMRASSVHHDHKKVSKFLNISSTDP